MKNDRRIIACIIYVILGLVLFSLGFAEIVDAFWSGMGAALLVVGILRMIQFYRYRKDESYREKVEVEITDERNRFIRNKAWAWAGYLFVLIAAVSVIVLKLMEQDMLSMTVSFMLCLMLVLYWVCYLILKKKY